MNNGCVAAGVAGLKEKKEENSLRRERRKTHQNVACFRFAGVTAGAAGNVTRNNAEAAADGGIERYQHRD